MLGCGSQLPPSFKGDFQNLERGHCREVALFATKHSFERWRLQNIPWPEITEYEGGRTNAVR